MVFPCYSKRTVQIRWVEFDDGTVLFRGGYRIKSVCQRYSVREKLNSRMLLSGYKVTLDPRGS